MTNPYRALPSIDRLLQDPCLHQALQAGPRERVVAAAREVLAAARQAIADGGTVGDADILAGELAAKTARRLQDSRELPLRRVINATGVVIHTNLGRAPLSPAALAAMRGAGTGYSNLEYDLAAGVRGSRHEHVSSVIRELTGADDALVVNNNAAAVLLALIELAAGRDVIISRGELVEIGGGLRIPDVLRQSGAQLVEVGTTNRTYTRDYEDASTERTGAWLWVHSSNYRVIGFVHTPELPELALVARTRGIPLIADLGSGSLLETGRFGLAHEPLVQEVVRAGADLICFSGDKLLGGPQAGIIVGRRELIARLKRHPLTRALRPDKTTIAALGATLLHYLDGEAERMVPVWRMISATAEAIAGRARQVIDSLGEAGAEWEIGAGTSAIGGGSLPGETLPTRLLIAPTALHAGRLAAALRAGHPAVVGRIEQGRLVLDLRTVLPEEDEELGSVLHNVLKDLAPPSPLSPVNVGAPAARREYRRRRHPFGSPQVTELGEQAAHLPAPRRSGAGDEVASGAEGEVSRADRPRSESP
jgi:L-seryl-tRNA(Ser) seleniumtransferase